MIKKIEELTNQTINRNIKSFINEYLIDLKVIVESDNNNSFSYEDIGYTKIMWSKSKNFKTLIFLYKKKNSKIFILVIYNK